MTSSDKALYRAACANFVSEPSEILWAVNLVAGDYRQSLYYRCRSVVVQDRALREFNAVKGVGMSKGDAL